VNIKPIKDELLERSILGSALISEDALHDFATRVNPKAFYNNSHKTIATELLKIYKKDVAVDLTLLSSKLGDDFYGYLMDLITNTGSLFAPS